MDPPDDISSAFIMNYYHSLRVNRDGLANLYKNGSVLSFEGEKVIGAKNIMAKLYNSPFQEYKISTMDCQISPNSGVLIFVSGRLQVPGEEHPVKFTQTFYLLPTNAGSFYVANDIFRLNHAI